MLRGVALRGRRLDLGIFTPTDSLCSDRNLFRCPSVDGGVTLGACVADVSDCTQPTSFTVESSIRWAAISAMSYVGTFSLNI